MTRTPKADDVLCSGERFEAEINVNLRELMPGSNLREGQRDLEKVRRHERSR